MSETTASSSHLIIFSEILLKFIIGILTSILLYTKLIKIPRFESGKSLQASFISLCVCRHCQEKQYTYPQSQLGYYRKLKTLTAFLFLVYLSIFMYRNCLPSYTQSIDKEQETSDAKILSQKVPYIYDLTDPWEILGIEENSDEQVIKKSYRKLMIGLHPDRVPAEYSENIKTKMGERFLLIQKAYETLTDPDLRERFNREGAIAQESYTFDFGIPKIFNKSENAARILILYIILAVIVGLIVYKVFKAKNSIFGMSEEKAKFLASKLYLQRQNGLRNEYETLSTVCMASVFNYNINTIILNVLKRMDANIHNLNDDINRSKVLKNLKIKLNSELIKKLNQNFIRILKAQDIDVEYLENNFKIANLLYLLIKCYINGDLEEYFKDEPINKSFKEFGYLLEQIDSTLSSFRKVAVEFNQLESIKQIIELKNKIIERENLAFYNDKGVDLMSKNDCVNFTQSRMALLEMKFKTTSSLNNNINNNGNENVNNVEEQDEIKEEEDDLTLLQFKKQDNHLLPVLSHNKRYPFPLTESYYVIVRDNKKIIFQDTFTVTKYKNDTSNFTHTFFLQLPIERFLFDIKNNRVKTIKKNKLEKSVKLSYYVYPMFGDVKHLYMHKEEEFPIRYLEEQQESVENDLDEEHSDVNREVENKDEISGLIDKYEKDNIFNMDSENEGSWYTLGSRNIMEFACNLIMLYVIMLVVLSTNTGRIYLQPIVLKVKDLLREGLNTLKRVIFGR
eukprot:GAHX01001705.1.p1 GENE.GAHX01001705.1~~GAHX01001705.1.p1  ORF type:complete len:742 (-),score=170.18 GAHX01001705.1:32-2236(-)